MAHSREKIIEQPGEWFCNWTFSTARNVFYQVYTIHASVLGVNLPLVYALLPDKKEASSKNKTNPVLSFKTVELPIYLLKYTEKK